MIVNDQNQHSIISLAIINSHYYQYDESQNINNKQVTIIEWISRYKQDIHLDEWRD